MTVKSTMTMQTTATRRKRECKLAFHVERRSHFLLVAIQGEASFEQAEFLSAQLLRIPLEAYSLVVLNLAELTFLSSLAMGALIEYRRDRQQWQCHNRAAIRSRFRIGDSSQFVGQVSNGPVLATVGKQRTPQRSGW